MCKLEIFDLNMYLNEARIKRLKKKICATAKSHMKEKPIKFSNFTKKYCNIVQLGLKDKGQCW